MKYNLGKYNLKGELSKVTGNVSFDLDCELKKTILEKNSSASTQIEMKNFARATLQKSGVTQEVSMAIDSLCEGFLVIDAGKAESRVDLKTRASGAILGEEALSFSNLELNPNETLVIDMCSLTAMIEQRNANKKILSGDFFEFLPTSNEITIISDGSINIDIEWRDRWL